MSKVKKTIWAFDCETPKFIYGRPPVPFCWCAISEFGDRVTFWGSKCTDEFMVWIMSQTNILLIGHNAGKFDTLFLKPIIHGRMLMVDGRIIKCSPKSGIEIRDSFAILPMALRKLGSKLEIDLDKHEPENQEVNKAEILRYCMNDCVVLLEAVLSFYQKAGSRKLTIASQASSELRTIYPDLPKLGEQHFNEFKPFFFGGRVQCFQKGIIRGKFKLFDVNSMYPHVMATSMHPYGDSYRCKKYEGETIPETYTGFFVGRGDTLGAFPIRQKDKSTPYSVGRNLEIRATLHEVRAALDCKKAANLRGHLFISNNQTTFDKFIIPHFVKRRAAQQAGDLQGDIYHKLIPNSSYGRFAMSPDGREEVYYTERGEDISELKRQGFAVKDIDIEAERLILARPVMRPWLFYEDVATGASITGAARAMLMRAIHSARNPLYCDTDSLLCEEFEGDVGSELGQWKLEAECDTAAIAGKKMYALFANGQEVKKASKGVRASAGEIYQVAERMIKTPKKYVKARPQIFHNFKLRYILIKNDAPVMRLKSTRFMKSKIRAT